MRRESKKKTRMKGRKRKKVRGAWREGVTVTVMETRMEMNMMRNLKMKRNMRYHFSLSTVQNLVYLPLYLVRGMERLMQIQY